MKIKEGFKVRNIAGENVIVSIGKLNVDFTKVVALNETSLWLWEQLQGKEFTADDAARLLTERYDVEPDRALADAGKWIDTLFAAGLIER